MSRDPSEGMIDVPVRRLPWPGAQASGVEPLVTGEWLLANGLGGYAGGSISGVITRRYHGLLVAALGTGRTIMFTHVWERLRLPDRTVVVLSDEENADGPLALQGARYLTEFRLELGLPVWRYDIHGFILEKRIERARGYEHTGELWSPGYFRLDLHAGAAATLIGSIERWEVIRSLDPEGAAHAERERRLRLLSAAPPQARSGPAAELVLAADQFIVTPPGRVEEMARARAAGEEARSGIAGYHWFTDWGPDTMISLDGLLLQPGPAREAEWVLHTFAQYVRDGLIPNLFPEGDDHGLYHTADATLWFFHAIGRYLSATDDRLTRRLLMPRLRDIVAHHLAGTHFGIGVDARDGLLRQGAPGYPLTWMDAKVGDWVVTPRRGKAVEINALWYNALRLLEAWENEEGDAGAAKELARHADRTRAAFNERFWYAEGGYCYDVVDGEAGDDPACRPNQIVALSLRHPVLDVARWKPMLDVVTARLLTPVGLRSLAPDHPDYKSRYDGDLRARDAAYHQGTVWAWLIGPFVDAWLRLYPDDRAGARRFLEGFVPHLGEACFGSISEVFDAVGPFTPRGYVAQAWSVAEVLRAWLATAPADTGRRSR